MPILSYECPSCGFRFEELVKRHDEGVNCPKCGSPARRVWAGEMFSATGKPPKKCSGKCSECDGCS